MDIKKIIPLILFLVLVSLSSYATSYTSSTETNCIGLTCTITFYSGTRFINDSGEWKKIENVKSLKEHFEVVYLKDDTFHKIEVIDFNLTFITLKYGFDLNSARISEFEDEIEEDKIKTKSKYILQNGTEFEIEIEIEDGEDYIVKYDLNPFGKTFSLGENSTTISLQDPDTENLDDAFIDSTAPDTNRDGEDRFVFLQNSVINKSGLIKFDKSLVTVGSTIDDATLTLYISNNVMDDDAEGFNISSHHIFNIYNWTEETVTWNKKPNETVHYNTTFTDTFKIFGGVGEPIGYFNLNVTEIIARESSDNVSIYLRSYDFFGNPSSGDGIIVDTKEDGTEANRPTLNITYSVIPPFSNNVTNASAITYNGTDVQISLTISNDIGVDFYRLSHNDTSDGSWINESLVDAKDSVSVTAIFNYSIHNFPIIGGTMGWKVWANDTSNNVNESDTYTFVVQDNTPPLPPLYCKKFYFGNISSGSYLFSIDCNGVVNLTNSLISNSIISTTNDIVARTINSTKINTSEICLNSSCIDDWSEVNVSGGGEINGTDISPTRIYGNGTDNVKIGSGDDSHSLTSPNDLFVTGKMEADGDAFFDGDLDVAGGMDVDGQSYYYGRVWYYDLAEFRKTTTGPYIIFKQGGLEFGIIGMSIDDGLYFSADNDDGKANRNFLFLDTINDQQNFGHNTPSPDPTIFIHSSVRASTNKTQWLSLTHNQTNGIIDVGSGSIVFKDDVVVEGTNTFVQNITALNYNDYTSADLKSSYEALKSIDKISKEGNKINHSSLSDFVRVQIPTYETIKIGEQCTNESICVTYDSDLNVSCNEFKNITKCTPLYRKQFKEYVEGRNIGNSITEIWNGMKELIKLNEEMDEIISEMSQTINNQEGRILELENQMELVMNASNITIIQSQPEFIGWYCAPEDSTRTDCRKISGSRCSLLIGWDTCVKDKVYGNWIEVYKEVK